MKEKYLPYFFLICFFFLQLTHLLLQLKYTIFHWISTNKHLHTRINISLHENNQIELTKFSVAFPLFSLFTMRIRPDTFSTKVSICERFPTYRMEQEKEEEEKTNDWNLKSDALYGFYQTIWNVSNIYNLNMEGIWNFVWKMSHLLWMNESNGNRI